MTASATVTDRDPLTDLCRHVAELTLAWTDRDGEQHPGLIACVTQHLIPVRMIDGGNAKGQSRSRIADGQEPWEAETGTWLADVHHGARRIESELRYLAWHEDLRDRRGGSIRNTVRCLSSIHSLACHLWRHDGEAGQKAQQAARTVAGWHRDGLLILGAQRRWSLIRWVDDIVVETDAGPVVTTVTRTGHCPHCGSSVRIQPTLIDDGDPTRHRDRRVQLIRGDRAVAICPRYDCRDANGARHTWRVDRRLGLLLRQADDDTNQQQAS